MDIELAGTKERIFDISIRLFAKKGFEKVSVRDIAHEAGIKAASIYNHFSGKDVILDTIYEYFRIHRLDNRGASIHMKETIETGTAIEIVNALADTPFELEEKITIRMVLIPKIILMRIYDDPKANQFFLHEWYDTDMKYLRHWLGYAISIRRLPGDFDIERYSMFFWRQLVMMAVWAFADPGYEVRVVDEEKLLHNMFADMLPLKEPL